MCNLVFENPCIANLQVVQVTQVASSQATQSPPASPTLMRVCILCTIWLQGRLKFHVEQDAGHHEGAWQWRFSGALRFLLSPWWDHFRP
jgi:hypothetical protein